MASILSSTTYDIQGKDKYVLNFDLDETLFEVTYLDKEDGGGGSTASGLDSRVVDVIYDTNLWNADFGDDKICKISAIAREKFQNLFKKITELNKDAGETVIYVNIITNANYSEEGVLAVLKRFYGDDFTIHSFTNSVERKHSKGRQMLADYLGSHWGQGVPRDHVYLIDDMEDNCEDAEDNNFKALCALKSFGHSTGGGTTGELNEEIFETLNKIVDTAREKIFAAGKALLQLFKREDSEESEENAKFFYNNYIDC